MGELGPAMARPAEFSPFAIGKHVALFVLTFITTTVAGMLWQNRTDLTDFWVGLPYSMSALFILSCHEFGHFFAARRHGVRVTLPYYIPLPPFPSMITFGTLGAVIRTKAPIPHRTALFDIGIAGPIAGFVASVVVLAVGFATLPGKDFLLGIHPDYDFALGTSASVAGEPALRFGSTLLYELMEWLFARPGAYIPPMSEMYHYPFLITGWFGLLVTALNLLPAGQLDGGHITFAMFGERQKYFGRAVLLLLLFFGGVGMAPAIVDLLGFTDAAWAMMESVPHFGALFWPGWLLWAVLILAIIKVEHPWVPAKEPLTARRRMLGWASYAMLLLCFTPAPLYFA